MYREAEEARLKAVEEERQTALAKFKVRVAKCSSSYTHYDCGSWQHCGLCVAIRLLTVGYTFRLYLLPPAFMFFFSLLQEEEHTLEECKRQEETAWMEAEEEALEAVIQKASWSVKQPLCVLQMHIVLHCRCLKHSYSCVLYNETRP